MRILFASLPAEGHFNPMTGVAVHLRDAGHDVRWYTGRTYAERVSELGLQHLPFDRAREVPGDMARLFPERTRLKGPALIRFDFEKVFVVNAEAYFEDIKDINRDFPFDVMLADAALLMVRLVREKLHKPVGGCGNVPMLATSPDVPPNFTGLKPARSSFGRLLHQVMGTAMSRMVLANGRRIYNEVLAKHGLAPIAGSIYDEFYGPQDVIFQNGVPGLEYPRRRMPPQLKFAGRLKPYRARQLPAIPEVAEKADDRRVILISQGTVDNDDPEKLIVPAIEALAPSGALVVVGTGYKHTAGLQRRFPAENVIIRDYVDFDAILERADAFICNGGYGSVLSSLSHGVPVVGAGTREGKNDVNAHIEYAGVGINLRTEWPTPSKIAAAVGRLLAEPSYRNRAGELQRELARYDANAIVDEYLAGLPRTDDHLSPRVDDRVGPAQQARVSDEPVKAGSDAPREGS